MYTKKSKGEVRINSVMAVTAQIRFNPAVDSIPTGQVTIAYTNKDTNDTWGSFLMEATLMSKETLDLARKFLESAEQDFGRLLFSEGTTAPNSYDHAESNTELSGLGDT